MTRTVLLSNVRRLQQLLANPASTDEIINNALRVMEYDVAKWRDADPLEPSWHQREAGSLASGVAIALFCACVITAGALLSC